MKIILLTSQYCYPCERAKKEVRSLLHKYPSIDIEIVERPHQYFTDYNIVSTPTLIFDNNGTVDSLCGAHLIKKIELEGLLRDLELI